ncbi:MAG TPA: acetyl-CoA carboxylase biotin carboxyl carrier protein [Roseiflexaceae bacterium]|nr:acetyl-CoA carboxylase biotin carboxyl carrier protein [Roseiflexaceae bacterium]
MTDRAGERQKHDMNDDFGLSALREVLDLLRDSDISELKIERGGSKLHIRRGTPPAQSPAPFMITPSLAAALPQALPSPLPPVAPFYQHAAGPPAPAAAPDATEAVAHGQTITSPMVGTFYEAPSPKDPPYVQEGDTIEPGDRVGIVEAMKMMNEIEAEIGGRIARILVKNGQPVEYGQPLMIVEPL